jgi:hypothetical protein
VCTLLAFVDDATSRLMTLRFVVSESAFDYFLTTRAYLETHGKPFYSDKHNIFRVNNGEGGNRVTQFGIRSLDRGCPAAAPSPTGPAMCRTHVALDPWLAGCWHR